MKTSQWLEGIQLSGIRKMFDMASKDSVHLGLGEPDFQPPEIAREALFDAVREGHNKYGPTNGIPQLREAIADHLDRMYRDTPHPAHYDGVPLSSGNIIVTSSGSEALGSIARSYYSMGDEVMIPDPGFVLYGPQARLCGALPVSYHLGQENNFVPVVDELEELVTSRTKAIIVNSPNNPTGGVMSSRGVDELCSFAEDHDMLLISDEVYDNILYNRPHQSFLGRGSNVIVANSFSKTLAMTGWRIGYVVASPEVAGNVSLSHYYNVACPPTPIQYAVLASLDSSGDFIDEMVREFRKRRDLIVDLLNDIDGIECLRPEGAFYVFPAFDHDITSEELTMKCAKAGLISSPGTAFGPGGEGHIRFSFAASPEKIRKGIDIFGKVYTNL